MQRTDEQTINPPAHTANVEALCRLLLDEERLAICGLLALGTESLSSLTIKLSLKTGTVARHLQQLCDGGVVQKRTEDGDDLYKLDHAGILALKKELFQRNIPRADLSAPEQVLDAFVKDGRLTHLPVHPDKTIVVLGWLAALFDFDVEYTERQVNETLLQKFDDYATLRRYLVDYGFMDRQGGRYWRLER